MTRDDGRDVALRGNPAWLSLTRHTPARIGLARAGDSMTTADMLAFQEAHAAARDAVHDALDADQVERELGTRAWPALRLRSAAAERRAYLLRPDLGRTLDPSARAALPQIEAPHDVAFVIADGLSASAVQRHAVALLDLVIPALTQQAWRIAPMAIVTQGRVAIGDEIGAALNAACVAVLIGERPGLSAPDSLGVYLTWAPKVGRTDAERNCISNIRPEGLALPDAAARLLYLLTEARRQQLTGVMLKDSGTVALAAREG
jgi:ethanolamine ammonia-lyase small subunit